MIAVKAVHKLAAVLGGVVALIGVTALLLARSGEHAADGGGREAAAGKSPPVTLEDISGSTAKRVLLTARASERLGIETGKVSEETVLRRQVVSGLIVPPSGGQPQARPAGSAFGGFAQAAPGRSITPAAAGRPVLAVAPPPSAGMMSPHPGEVWVLVTLSRAEWDRMAKDKPARVLPLVTGEKQGRAVLAMPSGMAPIEDAKRSMLIVYYTVPGKDHGLTLNKRMRVELQLAGSEEEQKVVPYAAVYYDAKGAPWVYVNSRPLAFERERIGVERVVGDLAVLSEGPPVGTAVVTVGAPLLYGAEIFKK
jgi:hypothetical protein